MRGRASSTHIWISGRYVARNLVWLACFHMTYLISKCRSWSPRSPIIGRSLAWASPVMAHTHTPFWCSWCNIGCCHNSVFWDIIYLACTCWFWRPTFHCWSYSKEKWKNTGRHPIKCNGSCTIYGMFHVMTYDYIHISLFFSGANSHYSALSYYLEIFPR
jgi:hypothetical protein